MKLSWENKELFENIGPGDIAIDCGAHVGSVTEKLVARGATVYAFEPNPHNFLILTNRFQHFANVFCHNKAVWDRDSQMRLYLYPNSDVDPLAHTYASSIIQENPIVDTNLYYDVQVIDLTRFILGLNSRIKFLKMDIEGAEFELLEKIITMGLHASIDRMVVETHEWLIPGTEQKLERIKSLMQEKGITNIDLNWV